MVHFPLQCFLNFQTTFRTPISLKGDWFFRTIYKERQCFGQDIDGGIDVDSDVSGMATRAQCGVRCAKNKCYLLVTASSMDSFMAVIVTDTLRTICWKSDPDGGVGLTCVSIFIGLFLFNIGTPNILTFIATNNKSRHIWNKIFLHKIDIFPSVFHTHILHRENNMTTK